jgi:hypothetical protein
MQVARTSTQSTTGVQCAVRALSLSSKEHHLAFSQHSATTTTQRATNGAFGTASAAVFHEVVPNASTKQLRRRIASPPPVIPAL